jgi:general secretion pathway protein G
MKKTKQSGFTLIELLVVIAIIGLLSTLAVVALNNARMKARDARRVSDVKQTQTALELYYNDANGYPATVVFSSTSTTNNISYGSTTYLAILPYNPGPQGDGTCAASNEYAYTPTGSAPYTAYSLTYCLGGDTGGIPAGIHTATPSGLR